MNAVDLNQNVIRFVLTHPAASNATVLEDIFLSHQKNVDLIVSTYLLFLLLLCFFSLFPFVIVYSRK